jgi:hypothetical protein
MTGNASRRHRWRPFVAFAVFLALVALLVPVFRRPSAIGIRSRFDQIQNGMSEDQLEELLGGPRGVYDRTRTGPTTTAAGTGSGRSHLSWWYFSDCVLEVGFDADGRVSEKRIEVAPRESLLERAGRWCEQTFSSPSP